MPRARPQALQRRRHPGRTRRAESGSRRQLVDQPDPDGATDDLPWFVFQRPERGRSRRHALFSRAQQRSLVAGCADRARQGRQFRSDLCLRASQAQPGAGVRLHGLLVLVRHAERLRCLFLRQRRRPDRSVAAPIFPRPLHRQQPRTASCLTQRRSPASGRWRVLAEAETRYPVPVQDQRLGRFADGYRLAGHPLSEPADPLRSRPVGVRRTVLGLHPRRPHRHDRRALLSRQRQLLRLFRFQRGLFPRLELRRGRLHLARAIRGRALSGLQQAGEAKRVAQQGQPDLACHTPCHGLFHPVRGLSPGWHQSQRVAAALPGGFPDQRRTRLENLVARQSADLQRGRVPRDLEQFPVRHHRSERHFRNPQCQFGPHRRTGVAAELAGDLQPAAERRLRLV